MSRKHIHPLRNVRNRRDLTIEQLAEEVKLGTKTIWSAEHYRPISAESRRRLCEYFGMTSQELGLIVDTGTYIPLSEKESEISEQTAFENADSILLSRRTFVMGTALFPLVFRYEQRSNKSIPQEAIVHLDALTHQYRDLQRKGVSRLESGLRGHIATIQNMLENTVDDRDRNELWRILAKSQLIARLDITKEQELGRAKTWNELSIAAAQYSGDAVLVGATIGHLAHLSFMQHHDSLVANHLISEAEEFAQKHSVLNGWFTIVKAAIASKDRKSEQCEMFIAQATEIAQSLPQIEECTDAFYTDFSAASVDAFAGNCLMNLGKSQKAYERLTKLSLRDLGENRHASTFYDIARACVAFGELAMAEDYAMQSIEKAVATNRRYIIPRFIGLAKTIRRKDQHEPHANAIFERACMALEQS